MILLLWCCCWVSRLTHCWRLPRPASCASSTSESHACYQAYVRCLLPPLHYYCQVPQFCWLPGSLQVCYRAGQPRTSSYVPILGSGGPVTPALGPSRERCRQRRPRAPAASLAAAGNVRRRSIRPCRSGGGRGGGRRLCCACCARCGCCFNCRRHCRRPTGGVCAAVQPCVGKRGGGVCVSGCHDVLHRYHPQPLGCA